MHRLSWCYVTILFSRILRISKYMLGHPSWSTLVFQSLYHLTPTLITLKSLMIFPAPYIIYLLKKGKRKGEDHTIPLRHWTLCLCNSSHNALSSHTTLIQLIVDAHSGFNFGPFIVFAWSLSLPIHGLGYQALFRFESSRWFFLTADNTRTCSDTKSMKYPGSII